MVSVRSDRRWAPGRELGAVIGEWVRGGGSLVGLLRAWLEIALGQVVVE